MKHRTVNALILGATLALAAIVGVTAAWFVSDDAATDAKSYGSVYELAAAAGISECRPVTPVGTDVLQRASCGMDYNVSIYTDHEAARRSMYAAAAVLRSLQRTGETTMMTFVIGPDWTINCGTHCAAVQARVGGSLVNP